MYRHGLKQLDDIFFEQRSKTITKGNSWYETQRDPEKLQKITEKAKQYSTSPYQAYQLWWGSVNQFRPAVATMVYKRYNPTHILDISAGWGGRCFAALEMGIPYTGIDSNVDLEPCYKELIDQFKDAKATMLFQPSETVAFETLPVYDMVFTSPPYFFIERYQNMPEYRGKAEFLSVFFRPVITESWKHLKTDGFLCLNMPEEMYEAVKDLLPELHEMLDMAIGNRFAKVCKAKRSEVIYVWKK
jgi:16S rRNA G966 N2-methylase RsmD